MPWRMTELHGALSVHVTGEMPSLPAALDKEVERHWRDALHSRPTLFNGRVFSADRLEGNEIFGHWTEYRRLLAQFRAPELAGALRLRALAVCGLLRCADGSLVLGRRDARAVYMPGRWQLVPAGNVDPSASQGGVVDLGLQLVAEFVEELGLPASEISRLQALCAVEHPGGQVIDIVHALDVLAQPEDLRIAHAASASGEITELRFLRPDALCEGEASFGESLMPLAALVLRRFGVSLPLMVGAAA